MLVHMACTLFVAAPIMAIGGVFMAFREDIELSWVMLVAVAVLVLVHGLGRRPGWCRPSGSCRSGSTASTGSSGNRSPGIRVVRAFVREPEEVERFRQGNAQVTEAALRAGRMMAFTFPVVMLTLNVASIAVVWVGASRVDSGDLQIGSLVAFLSYLAQVLMSVTMATFMLTMVPRAAVCAERIIEVLDTEPSVVDRRRHRQLRQGRDPRVPQRRVRLSRCGTAGPSDVSFEPGPARRPRSSGAPEPARRACSTSSPVCST